MGVNPMTSVLSYTRLAGFRDLCARLRSARSLKLADVAER